MATTRGVAASAPMQMAPRTGLTRALGGPKAVGSFVPRLTRTSFEKFGFSAATLVTDWATIVGAELAGFTSPERLRWPRAPQAHVEDEGEATHARRGATLAVSVDPARALDVQYRRAQIIERINAYFGYAAVAEIRIEQRPRRDFPPIPAKVAARPSAPAPREVLGIEDDALRAALTRLSEGVRARAALKR